VNTGSGMKDGKLKARFFDSADPLITFNQRRLYRPSRHFEIDGDFKIPE